MPPALNPLKPWQHAKASFLIAWRRLQGGALEANPWGTYKTLVWAYGTFIHPSGPPPQPGLDVGMTESDVHGFAIYGTVRVSGTNVIPP